MKFTVGQKVKSTSWLSNSGVMIVGALPGQAWTNPLSGRKYKHEFYYVLTVDGLFAGYHEEKHIEPLTKLELML